MSLLSDVVFYRTYSRVKSSGLKETWDDVADRYQHELIEKYPALEKTIIEAIKEVRIKRVVPSMRMLQFASAGIKRENMRGYNCSFINITSFKDIGDVLYVSMCGTGVGFSCKERHISQLPVIQSFPQYEYMIMDSKEGWANSIIRLLENPNVTFDYALLRPAGASLSTGGYSSGPEPLRVAHEAIRAVLSDAIGRKLTSLEVHTIVTLLSDCVVVGGVRRSALISLFDPDDETLLRSKHGEWWNTNPSFARANNSAQIDRKEMNQVSFNHILDMCFDSYSGEPGISLTNNLDWGFNPCHEIALRSHGVCNLTEINAAKCATAEEFAQAAWFATFLGTLQAGFTDFNYISEKWKKTAEEDALLGVSITGMAQNWTLIQSMIESGYLSKLAVSLKGTNAMIADKIGIKPAKRITTVKPSGTTSCVLDTTSGIHAAHSEYYIRRVRVNRIDPVGQYLESVLKDTPFWEEIDPETRAICIPYAMPGAILRENESAIDQLERAADVYHHWVVPGHREGDNTHNVSLTVSYDESEREDIKHWLWKNRESYSGVSLLPKLNHTYDHAPYEAITKEKYDILVSKLSEYENSLDLSTVQYRAADDTRSGESACSGGACEIK